MNTSPLAGATQDEMRKRNLGSLLKHLHVNGTCPRSELTALTGLNRSTVGALTAELEEAGLVRSEQPIGRGVGRPSIMVAPARERAYVLTIDVGVEHASVALIGLGGWVQARRELPHVRGETPRKLIQRASRVIESLVATAAEGSVCVGIGVSVPGVVRHSDGLVRIAPNLGWIEVPLGSVIATVLRTTLPIAIANDADLTAIAEHARGAARGMSHVVLVSGDVGVGGGIIIDGELMTGAGGYGGEIGHMVVNPIDGRLCRCGSVGCWETTIGEQAVREALGDITETDVRSYLTTVPHGDPRLAEVGRWLGIGVANLVNICNPQAVVFGGIFGDVYRVVDDYVAEQLGKSLSAPVESLVLKQAALGPDSVSMGAAELAFLPLLSDPLGHLARCREVSAA